MATLDDAQVMETAKQVLEKQMAEQAEWAERAKSLCGDASEAATTALAVTVFAAVELDRAGRLDGHASQRHNEGAGNGSQNELDHGSIEFSSPTHTRALRRYRI